MKLNYDQPATPWELKLREVNRIMLRRYGITPAKNQWCHIRPEITSEESIARILQSFGCKLQDSPNYIRQMALEYQNRRQRNPFRVFAQGLRDRIWTTLFRYSRPSRKERIVHSYANQ